jgi:hypothetical protein
MGALVPHDKAEDVVDFDLYGCASQAAVSVAGGVLSTPVRPDATAEWPFSTPAQGEGLSEGRARYEGLRTGAHVAQRFLRRSFAARPVER